MFRRSFGLMAVALAFAALPASAGASAGTVTVRVEGAQQTLVPRTAVTTSPGTFTVRDGDTCSSTSGGGALQLATGGDWGGRTDGQGQRVETVRGETYLLGSEYAGRYWSIYVNNAPSYLGICGLELQPGDELLLVAACGGATDGCFAGDPLDLGAPPTVRPGEAFDVHVDEYTSVYGPDAATATKAASAGANVAGGGAGAITDAAGNARLTLSQRGPVVLTVTKESRVRESELVCVSDGADGFCGTATPAAQAAPSLQCATDGADGLCGTADRRPPRAKIGSIGEGQRFARGRGPRLLAGIVTPDPSGLASVRLRLTRTDLGRCSTFDARRERLVAARCGAARGRWFSVGDRETWSYLLPARLGRGRYVLDVEVADRAGNVDRLLQRTRTRVVFHVL